MTPISTSSRTSTERKHCTKSHWRYDEDELLTSLVCRNGPENWNKIAAHIPGRTGKSCRVRWINQLNPRINRMPFTPHENRRLLELHSDYGNRWSRIAGRFCFRTDNQVKNQYHVLRGARYKRALGSSSSTDPHGPPNERSEGLFNRTERRPSFNGGSSSVYGQGEAQPWILSDGDSVNPHWRISRANSVVSDANSAEAGELRLGPQLQQVVGIEEYRFVDFLGVGSSE